MLPVSWNGSITIYKRVIRPFVLRHQKDVDSAIDKAADVTRAALKEGQYRLLLNDCNSMIMILRIKAIKPYVLGVVNIRAAVPDATTNKSAQISNLGTGRVAAGCSQH